jgi:multimeric flavodoxin WrbA
LQTPDRKNKCAIAWQPGWRNFLLLPRNLKINAAMKAIILLATLKNDGLSNTETLAEFHNSYLRKQGVECETIKLVTHNILPGTYLDMGEGDEWPAIFEKIKEASILIFATPIWWGNHSSEMQKVIERLDEINDKLAQGEESVLQNKTGGIIITGDSDGAQHIIGNISNFLNAVGVTVPPFCTLSVMSEEHKKGSEVMKEELLKKFNQNYAETAETMANGLVSYSQMLDTNQTTPS